MPGHFWLAPQFPPVYPESIKEKARARQIQAWLRSDFSEIRKERSTEVIFYKEMNTTLLSGAATRSFTKLISGLENLPGDGALNLFSKWCIADMEMSVLLSG